MRKRNFLTVSLSVALVLLLAGGRLWAAGRRGERTPQEELKTKMEAEGWKQIATGVFERQRGMTKVEHMGYGPEGLAWSIGELNRQREALMREYQAFPSEDLAKLIDNLSVVVAKAQRELTNNKSLASVSAGLAGAPCNICYGATADAYPLGGSSQGVGAIADAKFNSDCGYSGDTYAYAYARATSAGGTTTTLTQEDPHTGTSVTSHAAASVNGVADCLSTANSWAQSTALGISYSTSDSNSTCPAPPPPTLAVSLTCPAGIAIVGTNCKTLTWTATVTGGIASFSHIWKISNVVAGNGTSNVANYTASISQQYCGNNTTQTVTIPANFTVTDSTSPTPQTVSKNCSTSISYSSTVSGTTGGCLSTGTQPCQ